jgi:hypothetical protein
MINKTAIDLLLAQRKFWEDYRDRCLKNYVYVNVVVFQTIFDLNQAILTQLGYTGNPGERPR